MASINITEFPAIGRDAVSDRFPVAQLPALATQNVTFSGTSAQSSALNERTAVVRIRTDGTCAILIGADPTALTTSTILEGGTVEYFSVPAGSNFKIAVIAAS